MNNADMKNIAARRAALEAEIDAIAEAETNALRRANRTATKGKRTVSNKHGRVAIPASHGGGNSYARQRLHRV